MIRMVTDRQKILDILLAANQLKRTARTGWMQRGIPDAENVAAHSYGVAFTALILARLVDFPSDLGKVLTMALLHDLAEALTSDIPRPAWRFLPEGSKIKAERGAMERILDQAIFAPELMDFWEELHAAETTEARLVLDADKLDLYLQALVYTEQSGNKHLREFWDLPAEFHFPVTEALYLILRERAGVEGGAMNP